jgi:AmmeMemoRadiSam system protein A
MTTSASGGRGSDPVRLEGADRDRLVAVARAAVRAAAHGVLPPPLPADLPSHLLSPAGAFVSLHDRDGLRGCVGSVAPHDSLAALVARMAAAAATTDPRFPPVRPEELPGMRVEVSILSPARPVTVTEIDPTLHGVCLRLGSRGAVLLPQVAVRHGWDRGTLLAELCAKAELPAAAWEDPEAVLLAFTVELVEGDA